MYGLELYCESPIEDQPGQSYVIISGSKIIGRGDDFRKISRIHDPYEEILGYIKTQEIHNAPSVGLAPTFRRRPQEEYHMVKLIGNRIEIDKRKIISIADGLTMDVFTPSDAAT